MRYLKLSNLVINTSNISNIYIGHNYYQIYSNLVGPDGINLYVWGWINPEQLSHTIRKDKDPEDYVKVTQFIESIPDIPNN